MVAFFGECSSHVRPDPVGVGEEAELEDAFEVDARDGGKDRPRAGRDDEPVVAVFETLARGQVVHDEPPGGGIYLLYPVADQDLDLFLRELLGGAGDEPLPLSDDAGEEVGQAALADRRFRFLLVDRDPHLRVEPARPRSRLRTRRYSAHDHKPHR